MELREFITKHGDGIAAQVLGLEVRAVKSYRLLQRVPNPTRANEIIGRSDNKVTWEGIYYPYVKKKLNDKKSKRNTKKRGVKK